MSHQTPTAEHIAIECSIARHWPNLDRVCAETGATPQQVRAVVAYIEAAHGWVEPDEAEMDRLKAGHAAYTHGARDPAHTAIETQYQRARRNIRARQREDVA